MHKILGLSALVLNCAACSHSVETGVSLDECLARAAERYSTEANMMLAEPDTNAISSNSFGLFSHVYNTQPANGYPIKFDKNGQVRSGQYDGWLWSVEDYQLILRDTDSGAETTFTYSDKCNSLVAGPAIGENPLLQHEIAIVRELAH